MNNSMDSLVSVIVPIYKVEKYLSRCVDSLLLQTYQNLEIFLVDDGSPDKCGEICDEYAKKDARIKVIHKENGGLSDARNVAIDVASGEWIVFVDSDDYVSADYVENLYALVTKDKTMLGVSARIECQEGNPPKIKDNIYHDCVLDCLDALDDMFYQRTFDNYAWAKIYHKSLFGSDIRYPKGLIYEDLPTTYRLIMRCPQVSICNRATYFYMLRNDSIEGSKFSVRKLESAIFILNCFRENADKLANNERAVRCRLLSFCYHVLLEMPNNFPDERKNILINYVKKNKWKVFFDMKARQKARISVFLSIFGLSFMRFCLKLISSR